MKNVYTITILVNTYNSLKNLFRKFSMCRMLQIRYVYYHMFLYILLESKNTYSLFTNCTYQYFLQAVNIFIID